MQQIDEIRRMSELAKQLREHGLTKDNLDALSQARSSTSSDPAVAKQRQDDAAAERLATLERKLAAQQQRIDDLQRQLEQAAKKLSDYAGQMSTFSAKIRDLEVASTASINPIPVWQAAPPTAPTWQQSAERPPSTGSIDRNGVSPADVSVEKFFYFGKK